MKTKMNNPKVRRWTFTSFQITLYETLKALFETSPHIRYLVFQGEQCSTTKKDHIQGYIEFTKQMRRAGIKKLFRDKTIHLEAAHADANKNTQYCTKSKTSLEQFPPIELGDPAQKTQGTRTDLAAVAALIKRGASLEDILDTNPKEFIKYHNGISKAIDLRKSKTRGEYVPNLQVKVYYGDAGAGKTRKVYQLHKPAECYTPVWNGTKFWFNGYTGQKVLLINEFYGQCRTSVLQEMLDKYRIPVETKGGIVTSNWDTIYITSNCHPREWYRSWETIPNKVMQSIIRRIATIDHLTNPDVEKLTWESIPTSQEKKDVAAQSLIVVLPATSEPPTQSKKAPLRTPWTVSSHTSEPSNTSEPKVAEPKICEVKLGIKYPK